MRAWGRIYQPAFPGRGHSDPPIDNRQWSWAKFETDPDTGDNSEVYILNLIQVLLLNLNESPFFANYGIPAQPSVVQQVYPDIYVAITQQQFAPYFANLIIAKVPDTKPHYRINATTFAGVDLSQEVLI
jgi:hypothetical protein